MIIVTRGFGSGGSIPLVVTRGYGIGGAPAVVGFDPDAYKKLKKRLKRSNEERDERIEEEAKQRTRLRKTIENLVKRPEVLEAIPEIAEEVSEAKPAELVAIAEKIVAAPIFIPQRVDIVEQIRRWRQRDEAEVELLLNGE
jgi:hypothetical protein